ncbi:MAG: hypothetical protein FVQ77_02030 [Cytophagales bacterium]|nr:hypothetical protein [Cytophagales bacterium]
MKNLIKYMISMAIISVLIYGTSCTKDVGPIIIEPSGNNGPPVSFANDIQPIFNQDCTGCHDDTHPKLDLREGFAYGQLLIGGASAPYVDTLNAEQSLLYQRVTSPSNPMPPSGALQNFQAQKILKWIEQGAKNN